MSVGRKLLFSIGALGLLLVLAVGAFIGAAVYFRMEAAAQAGQEHWAETQAVEYAEQGKAWEALVTVHRVPDQIRGLQTGAVWRVLRILVRDGHDEVVLRYQETHRFDPKNPQKDGIARKLDVKLATIQAELGLMEDAAGTINRMKRPREQIEAMVGIASLLAIRGEYHEATILARLIPSRHGRVNALQAVSRILSHRGDGTLAYRLVEEALVNAQRISRDRARDYAIRDLAKILAEFGDHKEAIELVSTIGVGEIANNALGDIADIVARAGDFTSARDIAVQITDSDERVFALRRIMYTQLGQGNAAGAIRTATRIPVGSTREEAIFHAGFDHHHDFQFDSWNPAIAGTILKLADMMTGTGQNYPDLLRYCLLGDALAAGDILFASRAWLSIADDSYRPEIQKIANSLLRGRRFCRSIA